MRALLAYDGSPSAATAAALAGSLAWPTDTTLRVISIVEPVPLLMAAPWLGGATASAPELAGPVIEHMEAEVAQVVRQLQGPTRFVEGAVLAGRPATVVVDEATTFGADLVIVGSRGHGTIGELVLGSVSSEIVDHARCPVLVARRPAVSRVVLASDGSPSARAAEEVVAGWSIFRALPIRVVSVADVVRPWHSGIAPSMYGQVLDLYGKDLKAAGDEARRITVEAVGRLRQAGCDAEPDPRSGDAAAEIIDATDSWGADLVVLGSRGRSGLTRVLLGSVARNVAHGSTASVMVVHEPA